MISEDYVEFLENHAREVEELSEGSGIKYLEEILKTNPLFNTYLSLKDNRRKNHDYENEENDIKYPILQRVIRYPSSSCNYELLKVFLKSEDIPDNIRLRALKLLRKYAKQGEERLDICNKIYNQTQDKFDLYLIGYEEFYLGKHNDAFNHLSESLPYSVDLLSRCYSDGLGVGRSVYKAYNLLIDELKKHNELAKKPLERLISVNFAPYFNTEEARKLLASRTKLTEEEKTKALSLSIEKGYLTLKDIKKFYYVQNDYDIALLRNFLFRYNIDVYDCVNEITNKPTLFMLDYLFDLLEENSIDYTEFKLFRNYKLTPEAVKFYTDEAESNGDYSVTYSHTPAEASLYLDIPRSEACAQFELLNLFCNDNRIINGLIDGINYIQYMEESFSDDIDDDIDAVGIHSFIYKAIYDIERSLGIDTDY